jgi:hypothetical protein
MEAMRPAETFVTAYKTTRHHNPKDDNLYFHRFVNIKCHIAHPEEK